MADEPVTDEATGVATDEPCAECAAQMRTLAIGAAIVGAGLGLVIAWAVLRERAL